MGLSGVENFLTTEPTSAETAFFGGVEVAAVVRLLREAEVEVADLGSFASFGVLSLSLSLLVRVLVTGAFPELTGAAFSGAFWAAAGVCFGAFVFSDSSCEVSCLFLETSD